MSHRIVWCVAAILLAASAAGAMAPDSYLRQDGNNWCGSGVGGWYRFCDLRFYDDSNYPIEEYKVANVDFEFTAGVSADVQAFRVLLGNSDMCKIRPNMTVSIQTDDGHGNPSGTVVGTAWHGLIGVGIGDPNSPNYRVNTAGYYDFPVGTASLQAGRVYHIRLDCNDLQRAQADPNYPHGIGFGDDEYYPPDFRLYAADPWNELRGSDPNTWSWDKYKTRTYDGFIDPNLYGKYWDDETHAWRTGLDGTYFANPLIPEEYFKINTPLFQMFAGKTTADPSVHPTGIVAADPIEGLGQGFNLSSSSRTVRGATEEGECFVAHYPNTKNGAAAQSVRVYVNKVTTGGTWVWDDAPTNTVGHWSVLPTDPAGDLIVELWGIDPETYEFTCIAKGTISAASLPPGNNSNTGPSVWADAVLTDAAGNPVQCGAILADGAQYQVVVRAPGVANNAAAYYQVRRQRGDTATVTIGNTDNTFYGQEAYAITSVAPYYDATADLVYSLGIVVPGDANGDRRVDVSDLGILGGRYGIDPPPGAPYTWQDGDFSGDGFIDVSDLGILGGAYGGRALDFPANVSGGGVPEPATMTLLALAAVAIARPRRRHRQA